jgi:hypothetical protein
LSGEKRKRSLKMRVSAPEGGEIQKREEERGEWGREEGGVSEGGSARDFFGKDEEEQTVVALSAEHNELEGEIGGE